MNIIKQGYPIREDWEEYYNFLEALRSENVCNMYGAGVVLEECCDLPENLARAILVNWMHNYKELSEKYGWRK
jgi:hypothetical protein